MNSGCTIVCLGNFPVFLFSWFDRDGLNYVFIFCEIGLQKSLEITVGSKQKIKTGIK